MGLIAVVFGLGCCFSLLSLPSVPSPSPSQFLSCSFTLWCLVQGSSLLSSAVASTKHTNSSSVSHQQQRNRFVYKHPSFIDSVSLLTLALRLASNDLHALTNTARYQQFELSTQTSSDAVSTSQKPRDSSSSAWSTHTRQLPIWPNGGGSSLRAKMRAWSLDSLALAAYSLNDFAYSATLLCHALRCEGSAGDEEEKCVYSHHLTCCLSMLARHDHAFSIGRSLQFILKRRLQRLARQASGARGEVQWRNEPTMMRCDRFVS
jgi:hypothetical protein